MHDASGLTRTGDRSPGGRDEQFNFQPPSVIEYSRRPHMQWRPPPPLPSPLPSQPLQVSVTTLLQLEWPAFPRLALREAVLNAFGHRDYAAPGSIDVRQYQTRLEISSPGAFIAGITPRNILHHPPAARNEYLMELLDRLHLVNRANAGVPRIFAALLEEGHEPPQYEQTGQAVRLTLFAGPRSAGLRDHVRSLAAQGVRLDVDHLLVLHYLLRHREITAEQAGEVTQRPARVAAETLAEMSHILRLLEQVGRGRGRYFRLGADLYERLGIGAERAADAGPGDPEAEAAVLRALADGDLTNRDVREITGLDRSGVVRLIHRLKVRGVAIRGKGRAARYHLGEGDR